MDSQKETFFQKATPLPSSLNPQVVYSWKAPLRAYKKRSKNVLRFYVAVALLLTAIVFFLGDRILIIPIWSILFLFYVLTITPPPEVENRITKFGIETAGITIRWEALSHFYFNQRFGFEILTIVTHPPYNMHAYLVIPDKTTQKNVVKILAEHIVFQEKPQLTMIDKMISLLSRLIPDDEEEENVPATIQVDRKDGEVAHGLGDIKDTLASFFQRPEKTSLSPQSSEPKI
ncbi:hypothetical protein COU87_03940 [Candidatus Roizmanbacteria bacterium CG10_big_fil_rev_8_21_14_0_10_39_12]|uniref:DUF5673 domain-containing protein n=1 Tax=Candidatus Roizmanbacteria bacterium CG10_big_fil_rev_8_21_14_0_10_39_12 TaxID=1974852 RepID=A0A2M8KNQ9_9BACT|nr:MAG: hypothetical protein COY15_02920 [Candidatus Roizmanbacteria bacterium CG_4_10_14_0_2_um_filter_39_12]PJE61557.1 MAG: hypothetical protein COU87_03940 [Candidatus Roizmanbacteria bacterium CG10_big_fil_rev_8_21_14_0_10_39_12]